MNFIEWTEHWGEKRLKTHIAEEISYGKDRWENRETALASFPAWELIPGGYWEEDLGEWHKRWRQSGGRLFENGRMLAAKWDPIWGKLSDTFPDGLGNCFPPFARSSCASWNDIDQDEAIVLGVISEKELSDYTDDSDDRAPLTESERALMRSALREIEEKIHASGGPRPGASRAERFYHDRKRKEEQAAKLREEYLERAAKNARIQDEKNEIFRLMESSEEELSLDPNVENQDSWAVLCAAAQRLTSSEHFNSYPNWHARAWILTANLHRARGRKEEELAALEYVLTLNAKAPVKRRIAALRKNLE